MIYSGLGFLMLAVTMLILATVAGVHGAGGFINVALLASLALLAGGALFSGRPRFKHLRVHRPSK
jgi:hypothetical protein